ncbi:MAG: ribonuclease III family protein [Thermoproteota archaeon]|nr:ribonuclease III family protein [Thermoproteota archaeon]
MLRKFLTAKTITARSNALIKAHNVINLTKEKQKLTQPKLPFLKKHQTLTSILTDQKLAKLGDAYLNFTYSLALTKRKKHPTGVKVESRILAEALKKANLRKYLPHRTDRHKQADAAEALVIYAWNQNLLTIQETVQILQQHEDAVDAFSSLICLAKTKIQP